MAERVNHVGRSPAARGHVAVRVVTGLAYVIAGLLVLLAQIGHVTLQWSAIAPAALLILGLGLLFAALVDAHVERNPRRG